MGRQLEQLDVLERRRSDEQQRGRVVGPAAAGAAGAAREAPSR